MILLSGPESLHHLCLDSTLSLTNARAATLRRSALPEPQLLLPKSGITPGVAKIPTDAVGQAVSVVEGIHREFGEHSCLLGPFECPAAM